MKNCGSKEFPSKLGLVDKLSRGCSYKGSDVRIVQGGRMRPNAWPRGHIPARWWSWKTVIKSKFKNAHGSEHINVLEARALFLSLRWRSRSQKHCNKRFLHLLDSQVNLAVLAKGRTSAFRLIPLFEKISSLCLASALYPLGGYVRTDDNPSDDPSRLRKLRKKWVKRSQL